MNEAQELLMCIPATAIAITVLIWLQSMHDRIASRDKLRAMHAGPEQRIAVRRPRMRPRQAAPFNEPITIEELRSMLGGDVAAMPQVHFDVEGGFSEPGQSN